MMKRSAIRALAAVLLTATAGCSPAGGASEQERQAAAPSPRAMAAPVLADAAAQAPKRAAPVAATAGSRVLGKRDFALRGQPACDVSYVYAGHEPDNLFWEEPCAAVTAKMMTRQDLESLGKWERLDGPAQGFVAALPGGRVLYVEGSFSASVYPVGTTGAAYEVPVAD